MIRLLENCVYLRLVINIIHEFATLEVVVEILNHLMNASELPVESQVLLSSWKKIAGKKVNRLPR